jgi:hypothetical protein
MSNKTDITNELNKVAEANYAKAKEKFINTRLEYGFNSDKYFADLGVDPALLVAKYNSNNVPTLVRAGLPVEQQSDDKKVMEIMENWRKEGLSRAMLYKCIIEKGTQDGLFMSAEDLIAMGMGPEAEKGILAIQMLTKMLNNSQEQTK